MARGRINNKKEIRKIVRDIKMESGLIYNPGNP